MPKREKDKRKIKSFAVDEDVRKVLEHLDESGFILNAMINNALRERFVRDEYLLPPLPRKEKKFPPPPPALLWKPIRAQEPFCPSHKFISKQKPQPPKKKKVVTPLPPAPPAPAAAAPP